MLVNNKGVIHENPDATAKSDYNFADPHTFQTTFATNLFGAVTVTEAFLPLLRRSALGRIVNVSSTMGSLNDQSDPDSPFYPMSSPPTKPPKQR